MKIYPSLISADLLNLKEVLAQLDAHCDGYHLDVMDDHFVPNLTWGPGFINAIAAATTLPLHVHLMVENPFDWLDRLHLAEKDCFIFHQEVFEEDEQIKELTKKVQQKGWQVGIALNPKTSVKKIKLLLPLFDEVLLMSVEPGFSGQLFIDVLNKVDELSEIRMHENLRFAIGMDGGINQDNIGLLVQRGVEFVGVASAIFSKNNMVKALQDLYQKAG